MITFDAVGTGTSDSTTQLTFAHTCTGMDRLLLVSIESETAGNAVTGVTYGGVAMTIVDAQATGGTTQWLNLYYLINPKSGANNVVVSYNTTVRTFCVSASYRGAYQVAPYDSKNKSTATSTSITTATTTVADHCWVFSSCVNDGGTITAGTGVTSRGGYSSANLIGDSNGEKTPAGSYSMTWNINASKHISMVIASFKQGGGSSAALLNML